MSQIQLFRQNTKNILVATVPVIVAATLGSWATLPHIPGWYAHLTKPWFAPPNWIFGPAWTLLYILIAVAAFRILSYVPESAQRRKALLAHFVQLFLNGLWSFAFFGAENPLLGLVVVVLLIIMVATTLVKFITLDRWAGRCFVPYLVWVSFAATLNAAVWYLN